MQFDVLHKLYPNIYSSSLTPGFFQPDLDLEIRIVSMPNPLIPN